MPVGAVLVLFVAMQRRRQLLETRRRESQLRSAVVFLVAVSIVSLAAVVIADRFIDRGALRVPAELIDGRGSAGLREAQGDSQPYRARFRLVPAVIFASVIVGIVVAAILTALWQRRLRDASHPGLAPALAEELDETIDDLRAEPDARRAVVAAYARMERTLAAYGLPRRSSEAPLEYLARVLLELRVGARAVRRLTALFERAKFSSHEIDAAMKAEAIDALVRVRDDLRKDRDESRVLAGEAGARFAE